jgi:hypothetical protein
MANPACVVWARLHGQQRRRRAHGPRLSHLGLVSARPRWPTAAPRDLRRAARPGSGARVIATRFQPDGSSPGLRAATTPGAAGQRLAHPRAHAQRRAGHPLPHAGGHAVLRALGGAATSCWASRAGHARNAGHRPAGVARCADAAALSHAEAAVMSTPNRLSVVPTVGAAGPSSAGRCTPGNLASWCQSGLTATDVMHTVQLRVSIDTCRRTRVQVLHVQ